MSETVLYGLPPEYKKVFVALRARDNEISFDDLHDKLTDFESQLSRNVTLVAATTMFHYTIARSGSNRQQNNNSSGQSRTGHLHLRHHGITTIDLFKILKAE